MWWWLLLLGGTGGVLSCGGGCGGGGRGRGAVGLEQLEDFRFGQVEAEGFEGDFEFVVVDPLVFVEVEERKL